MANDQLWRSMSRKQSKSTHQGITCSPTKGSAGFSVSAYCISFAAVSHCGGQGATCQSTVWAWLWERHVTIMAMVDLLVSPFPARAGQRLGEKTGGQSEERRLSMGAYDAWKLVDTWEVVSAYRCGSERGTTAVGIPTP